MYSSRYIGSLVADFRRTLLKGGVFIVATSLDVHLGWLDKIEVIP